MAYSEKYKRFLHRLGYYDYQEGLIRRHLGQDEGWKGHLENCRQYIIDSVNDLRPSVVTVLGSGWLLDLPLAEMLDTGCRVRLLDIVHPPDAWEQVAGIDKVSLYEEDATGGFLEELMERTSKLPPWKKLESVRDISVPEYKPGSDPGLVISLNLLSQLDVLPLRFLAARSRAGNDELQDLRHRIQDMHIRFLTRHRSVLITDTAEIFTSSDGEKSEVKTVITELPQGQNIRRWTWDFDAKGSDYFGKRSVMKVTAMRTGI